jgi:MFS family permease
MVTDGASARNDDRLSGNFSSRPEAVLSHTNRWTTIAMCVCMFTHSFLLISVFPYSGFLVIHLLKIQNEDDAAKYAGLISSAFMVGRASTSVLWGYIVDRYGRRYALFSSLLLSALFSLLFGFTKTFTGAIIFRFFLGCSNGIVATIKTTVSDLYSKDVKVESRTMNIVMGMWGWGFLVSPVISGILAEPIKQYSDTEWFADDTFFGTMFREYPFVLPNLLGTILCVISTALAQCFLYETLPLYRQHSIIQDLQMLLRPIQNCVSVPAFRYESISTSKSDLSDHDELDEFGDDLARSKEGVKSDSGRSSIQSILSQDDTRACIILLWGYSFVGLAIDEAFPLFCLSHTAGFGSLEKDIGKIMSLTGLIFAVAQYFVAHYSYKYCGGLSGSTKLGAALSAPTMFLIPFALLINHNSEPMIWPTYIFLAIVLSIHRCFSMVFFSNIAVAMNRTVPTANRGAMNGVAGLGASISKAIGPTFAGFLTTYSVIWMQRYASILIFGTLGLLGVVIALGTLAYLPSNATNDYTQVNESIDDDDDDDRNGIELKQHQNK